MELNYNLELKRIHSIGRLERGKKSKLGQFFTPSLICEYMSSMFDKIEGDVNLLDPGCGMGSLFVSFVEEFIKRGNKNKIEIEAFDLDSTLRGDLEDTVRLCYERLKERCSISINYDDYIFSGFEQKFSHVIMNPPYGKITKNSTQRVYLREMGVDTGNLYSSFLIKAIKQTRVGGEIVAIIPRSFANGLYFLSFRRFLLEETSIEKIHVFDKRNSAFSEEKVLQENIIIHLIKGKEQGDVLITKSSSGDFYRDSNSKTLTADDLMQRRVSFDKVVNPKDKDLFIRISSSEYEQKIIDRLSIFTSSLEDINVEVSTGPVVDFRVKESLIMTPTDSSYPLIYPNHLREGVLKWPVNSKKPNGIELSNKTRSCLWENEGCFLLVKRFSSKEEKKRIVATIYDSSLPGKFVGFENKLNVFHLKKKALNENLVKGLYLYLNSSLIDKYYRGVSGNTQVNATDLRALRYPSREVLEKLGEKMKSNYFNQEKIDEFLNIIINDMLGKDEKEGGNPLDIEVKINEAIEVIASLGMPKAQQNERSALTLLALLDLKPDSSWNTIGNPMKGVTPIMEWVKAVYGKEYAPNTRETFRRQTLHQFIEGGLVAYNPDKPERPPNSPKACYQVVSELKEVLMSYEDDSWGEKLADFLAKRKTLVDKYAMERKKKLVPLMINGEVFNLTPGDHSVLIKKIIEEFGPQFVPGSELIYVGDTENKTGYYQKNRLESLGVIIDSKGKLPDVILYYEEKKWLVLVESVTSHGPVDGKRYNELKELFKDSKADLVYVTAFLNRKAMARYISEISWESEVWVADSPTHMIHFNGHKFLGPY
ncbi:BsuBI/PstI family type II restriction endonuclease [Tenacibaculum sp. SDUM215027]|uniref:BsuBI/PstI family type II restriction endonuclease n=1 Tax=Tenacibaculum sp. SDUM215027 TaxID=3422596 RepID=UPI003D31E3A2